MKALILAFLETIGVSLSLLYVVQWKIKAIRTLRSFAEVYITSQLKTVSSVEKSGALGTLFQSKGDGKRRASLYSSTDLKSTTEELSSGLLNGAVKLGTMRCNDNKKHNKHELKKLRGLTLRSKLDCTSFSYLKRSALRERGVKRCGRRNRLKKRLKRRPRKPFATLKKLYNCPKTVSARPYKPKSLPQSVRKVVVLVQPA
jgi:hypothetical protein